MRHHRSRLAAPSAAALEQRAQAAGGPVQAEWRPGFDAAADDLRAALGSGAGPGPDGTRHALARSLGHLAYAHRYLAEARGHFERAAGLAPGAGQGCRGPTMAGLPDATQRLAAAAPAAQENLWAAACLARAHGRLHDDRAALEESLAGWQRIGSRFEHACTLLLMPDRAAQGHAELDALGCPPPAT